MNGVAEFIITTAILFGVPALFIWGWIRWFTSEKPNTLLSYLSFAGFTFASISVSVFVGTIIYGSISGGFQPYAPGLLRMFRVGTLLSLTALALGVVGTFKPSAVRWHAPLCGLGTLLFWIFAAASE